MRDPNECDGFARTGAAGLHCEPSTPHPCRSGRNGEAVAYQSEYGAWLVHRVEGLPPFGRSRLDLRDVLQALSIDGKQERVR